MRTIAALEESTPVLRLNPSEISEWWPHLKPLVAAGLPPATEPSEELLSRVLVALMRGDMWMWVVGATEPLGIVTGTVTQDICVRNRCLLLHSVWFLKEPSLEVLREVLHVLVEFSKTQGCVKLAGFVNDIRAINVLREMKNVDGMFYVEAWTNGRRS